MILAELEIYHSRSIAPTRRVALGRKQLPTEPAPGFGGILLGGIVARHIHALDDESIEDFLTLITQVERGARVAQPRLRYRLQEDKVGLQLSTHRMHGEGEKLWFEFDDIRGEPHQQLLGAVYATGDLPYAVRQPVMAAIRRSVGWTGPVGADLIATLAGFGKGDVGDVSGLAVSDPVGWALVVLGFTSTIAKDGTRPQPPKGEIQKRFRDAIRTAHPDHGGGSAQAAQRIAELTQARRILLGH